jgi:hypothetical protein
VTAIFTIINKNIMSTANITTTIRAGFFITITGITIIIAAIITSTIVIIMPIIDTVFTMISK